MPEAGVVFGRCWRHAADFFVSTDAGLPPGSFLLDESSGHGRVGGCGWEFERILCGDIARRAADFDWIAFGHGAECRSVRRDTGCGAAVVLVESLEGRTLPF